MRPERYALWTIFGNTSIIPGLYRLEISHNLLTDIADDSFIGLERSLWELLLQHNELTEIPSRALRHLQKLVHLGKIYLAYSKVP